MISIRDENLMTLAEVAKVLPRCRAGKLVHASTVYRWAQSGLRGLRLETLQVGGRRCTSQAALQRFFDALSGRCVDQTEIDDEPT